MSEFHCGLARVSDENDKYGYINEEGKEVIACEFGCAEDFSDDLALVAKEKYSDSKFYINKEGQIVFTRDSFEDQNCVDVGILYSFNNGIVPIYLRYLLTEEERKVFIDTDGNLYRDDDQIEKLSTLYKARRPGFLDNHPNFDVDEKMNCSKLKKMNNNN